jgi:Flp pilus assembly protein TadG
MKRKELAIELALHMSRFKRDESGVATIFACFMIMMMVLVGGIGVDLMRAEMERTKLQNTLDRAVLAAADLDQTLTASDVVIDYFEKSGIEDLIGTSNITVDEGLNYRVVTAGATTLAPTQFMHLMGVDELKVPALGTAEERISNVEISLVVDVSGSMAWDGKMDNLKTAAKEFARAVLRPETQDLVSLTLVPYSEHVNIGSRLFSELNTTNRHNFSYCVEFPDAEFSSAALDTSLTYDQVQHYQWNYDGYNNDIEDTVCPQYEFESVTAYSQSVSDLETQIDQLTPRAGTSIFLGVKWGAAFLDPSTRPIVTSLIGSGDVDAPFAGRPVAYDDAITLKTMIVMTDGKNDRSNRIANWAYNSASEYVHWSNYNFWHYMNSYVHYSYHSYYYWQKYDAASGDTLTDSICTEAKNQGIVIWGVGFEVDDHGADVLEDCASSESHFFRVEGVEISEAFKAIASQINQLRLTQ